MAIVFSYARFSSWKHEGGDSIKRQNAMRNSWLARHPEHVLNKTLSLLDLEVESLSGKSLDPEKGDLGKFIVIAKQKNSPIPKGSILMIESLDRLSRMPPSKSSRIIHELVDAGVKVLTLDPEVLVDMSNVNDVEVTLPLTIRMRLSYEENRRKSERISRSHNAKRSKGPYKHRCPAWIEWDRTRFIAKRSAVPAIKHIYQRTSEGVGQRRLIEELTAKFPPIGQSGHWNLSYIAKILADRAVLGELQVTGLNEKGERVILKTIAKYYPKIISKELYDRAQAARKQRINAKGPNRKFVNLFAGIIKGTDGYSWRVQTVKNKTATGHYIQRRLVSSGHLRKEPSACKTSVNYYKVEEAVLHLLREISEQDIIAGEGSDTESLNNKEKELQEIDARLAEMSSSLANLSRPSQTVLKAVAVLEARRYELEAEIDKLQKAAAIRRTDPLREAKLILDELKEAGDEGENLLRLKLRGIIAILVKEIRLAPYRRGYKVGSKLAVEMKTAMVNFSLDLADLSKIAKRAHGTKDLLS
jgi:hypothetical protein